MVDVLQVLFWISIGALFYQYVGFPVVLHLLPRSRQIIQMGRGVPTVSIVIAAYNEEKCLAATLENLVSRAEYPREKLEIVVASDGSSDATVGIARRYEATGVRVVDSCERRGKSAVLNDAVAVASGELLCFIDANVLIRPDALNCLVKRFEDARIGAVSGDVRLESEQSSFGAGERFYYRLQRSIELGESRVGSLMGVDGGMFMIRAPLYRPLLRGTILDDFTTSMNVIRQGYRIVYEPRAIADESGTPLASQEFRRRVRVSAGAVQSIRQGTYPSWRQPIEVWQYFSHKLLRWLDIIPLVALLVSSLALCRTHWVYSAACLVQVAAYGVGLLATVCGPVRRLRLGGVAFYFLLSHAGMVVGFAKGIFNRQAVTWTPVLRGSVQGQEGGAGT